MKEREKFRSWVYGGNAKAVLELLAGVGFERSTSRSTVWGAWCWAGAASSEPYRNRGSESSKMDADEVGLASSPGKRWLVVV